MANLEATPDTRLQVEKEMSNLKDILEGLSISVDTLSKRLSPIKITRDRILSNKQETPELCDLAQAIHDCSIQVVRQRDRIQDLIGDLQI